MKLKVLRKENLSSISMLSGEVRVSMYLQFSKNIQLDGQILVQNGIMIGAAGELILRKIIDQM